MRWMNRQKWGAVNTIVSKADMSWRLRPLRELKPDSPVEIRSRGFNTDADAIVASLREDLKMELRGAKVLLLGAGGAGRTAALKLACGKSRGTFSRQSHTKQSRRNRDRNQKTISIREEFQSWLSENKSGFDFERHFARLEAGRPLAAGRKTIFLETNARVYDMIYRPAETRC